MVALLTFKTPDAYFKIAAALINKFHPVFNMQGAIVELARKMRLKAEEPNTMQARVETENWLGRRSIWEWIQHLIPDFPRLDLEYLKDRAFGIYQVNLCPGYIQDKLQRDQDDQLQIEQLFDEANVI